MSKNYVHGHIKSERGFYVGDICYQLKDEFYDGLWINDYDGADGIDEIAGYRIGVGGTAYGDGDYQGSDGKRYGVDAGVIGVVPYELCKDTDEEEIGKLGRFVKAKDCEFEAEDGYFTFKFDDGTYITIDTRDEEDDEDEEEYEDEYEYEDEDDEDDCDEDDE